MKTALQQAIEQMNQSRMNAETVKEAAGISFCVHICNQLLEKEREQIEEAYWDGGHDVPTHQTTVKEYYEKTYGNESAEQ